MTTITWKNLKTGKNEIKIYKSRDELINTLRLTTYKITESKKYEYYLTIKSGKKILEQLQLYAVSYEEDDEKAIFQKYHIIPSDNEYDKER